MSHLSIVLDCFGMTDRGRHRKNNEDHILIAHLTMRPGLLQTTIPELNTADWSQGTMGQSFQRSEVFPRRNHHTFEFRSWRSESRSESASTMSSPNPVLRAERSNRKASILSSG